MIYVFVCAFSRDAHLSSRCILQALPIIAGSLRVMCRSQACIEAAYRTGHFLHVQQSLLSDLHRHERAYLEDTQGALEVLADKLQVRFTAGPSDVLPLKLAPNGCITLSLGMDCIPDSVLPQGLSKEAFISQTYGLVTALFTQVRE